MGYVVAVARGAFVVTALLSPFFFTAFTTTLLALVAGAFTPLVPLAAGLLLDTLYWSSGASTVPWYTIYGAVASLGAFGMHRFFETRIMHV